MLQVRRTVPAINLGFGAIGLITNNVGVRFDVRHLRSLSSDAPIGGVGRQHFLLAIHDRTDAAAVTLTTYSRQATSRTPNA